MPFDACSRIEIVRMDVFKRKLATPAPARIQNLVRRIAHDLDMSTLAPTPYFTKVECRTTYGGRWFPDHNSIVIIEFPDDARIERAVTVHEMGHWYRFVRGGDAPGEHDSSWQAIMRQLYPRYGVNIEIARELDRASGIEWGNRW